MLSIICQILVYLFVVQVFSTDDLNNESTKEMVEDGKNQYQLLKERGNLPRYGECWTASVEYIHEGCRYLTESVQSDIALQLTNCFLDMSGHATYNCELNKKPNLRGICINSMSDRAFNVYTEFYTHAQNICWFLRGQVWQEKISERTFQVGEQLKNSVSQQELLLKQQKESLSMQQELLTYGKSLEKILNDSRLQAENVMEEIRISTQRHQQLLSLMTNSLSGLQSWLIGEISWFDSLVFYIGGAIIIVLITSTYRTASARLPLLLTLSMNIVLERLICSKMNIDQSEIHLMHQDLYRYIWWCRQFTIVCCILIIIAQVYFYRDYIAVNNTLLLNIQEQNLAIKEELEKIKFLKHYDGKFNIIRESPYSRRSVETEVIKPVIVNYFKQNTDTLSEISKNSVSTHSSYIESPIEAKSNFDNNLNSIRYSSLSRNGLDILKDKYKSDVSNRSSESLNLSTSSTLRRYNLRNRTETPSKF